MPRPEGYTSLDIPLQVGPLLCESLSGLLPKAISMSVGLETAGVEATLLFQEVGGISRELVNAGAYRGAIVTVFAAPWEALLTGAATDADCVPLLRGRFGGAPDLLDESVTPRTVSVVHPLAGTQVGRTTGGFAIARASVETGVWASWATALTSDCTGAPSADKSSPRRGANRVLGCNCGFNWISHARLAGPILACLRMMGGELEGAEFAVKQWESGGRVLLRTPIGILPDIGTRIELEEGCDRNSGRLFEQRA